MSRSHGRKFVWKDSDLEIVGTYQKSAWDYLVEKHATHDQKSHGNWADGSATGSANFKEIAESRWKKPGLTDVSLSRTQKKYLRDYTAEDFDDLNEWIRTDEKSRNKKLRRMWSDEKRKFLGKIDRLQDNLNSSMSPSKDDVIMWRGGRIGVDSRSGLGKLKKGAILRDIAYVSTSMDKNVALEYTDSGKRGSLFRVRVPKGTRIISVNDVVTARSLKYGSESEVILDRGLQYVLTNITESDNSPTIYDVEVIPSVTKAAGDIYSVQKSKDTSRADYERRWRAANPEAQREHTRRYRASAKGKRARARWDKANGMREYRNALKRVKRKKKGGKCANCGAGGRLEMDHKKSRKDGGATTASNIQMLCPKCHKAKTARQKRSLMLHKGWYDLAKMCGMPHKKRKR